MGMKNLFNYLFLSGLVMFVPSIDARINFGSKNSSVQIAAGAKFNVGSSNLSIDGTLKGESTSSIMGNTIAMNHGVIDFDSLAVEILGTFDPTGADIIRLNGNNTARADAGTVINEIRVQGANNSLFGQPTLKFNITLADAATDLTIAIQSSLNKSIDLNGGTLKLGSELTLADHVDLNGTGTVDLHGYRLNLGGIDSTLTGTLTLLNSTDLSLHGNIALSGTWTFSSDARINGNGCIIDMTHGKFKLNPGVTLYLDDVSFIGVSGDSSTGSFIFDSNDSSIRTTTARFDLIGDVTISRGKMYIDGETTLVIKDHNWSFIDGSSGDKGILIVNNCLWIDVFTNGYCNTSPPRGELRAPNAIFVNTVGACGVYNQANVAANIIAGNLVLNTDCRIREVTDFAMETAGDLVGGPIVSDRLLTGNVTIAPNQQMIIAGGTCDAPITIDGQGASIIFTDARDGMGNPIPQFIVLRDQGVRLKNITLTRLNGSTIEVQGNGCLIINKNVYFELIEDIVFDGQERNQPSNPTRGPGRIIVEGPDTIFKIRGLSGRKRFKLNLPDVPTEYIISGLVYSRGNDLLEDPRDSLSEKLRIFNLGSRNSVMLENIEFSGLGFMDFYNRRLSNRLSLSDTSYTPNTLPTDVSIVLAGSSAFDVDRDTKMNFDVENLPNELVLMNDGITLLGTISFLGLAEQNVLNIRHMINDSSLFIDSAGILHHRGTEEFPFRLGLNGDPGIFLNGVNGDIQAIAGIIFDDANLELINGNTNSFVIDANSFVRARRILLSGNAIKQASSLTDIDDFKKFEGKIDSGFIRARDAGFKRPTSAFIRMRDLQRKALLVNKIGKAKLPSSIDIKEASKIAKKKQDKIAKTYKLRGLDDDDELLFKGIDFNTGEFVNDKALEKLSVQELMTLSRKILDPTGGYAPPDYNDEVVTMRFGCASNTLVSCQKPLSPFIEQRKFIRCKVNDFSHDVTKGFALLLNETVLNQAPGVPIVLIGTRSGTLSKEIADIQQRAKKLGEDGSLFRAVLEKINKKNDQKAVGDLDPLHVINVLGLNNIINVTGDITIGRDTLNFDDTAPAALTFNFNDSGITPRVIISRNTVVKIPKDGALFFRGRGQVILEDGAEIQLGGQSILSGLTPRIQEVVRIEGRAVLGLFDKAVLTVKEPEVTRSTNNSITNVVMPKTFITGAGTVFIDTGASIDINNFGSMIIAPHGLVYNDASTQNPNQTIKQLPDDIIMEIRAAGDIRIGIQTPSADVQAFLNSQVQITTLCPELIAAARLLTGKGNFNWIFERDGKLIIRNRGRFEFNNDGCEPPVRKLDGTHLTRGYVRELTFTDGSSLYIGCGGRLVLGINTPFDNRTEKTFKCYFEPVRISGQGSVEWVDIPAGSNRISSYTGFAAELKGSFPQTPINDQAMTMLKLMRILVNINDNLIVAIEFIDADDCLRKVRTRNGVIVVLQDGDILLSENANVNDVAHLGDILGRNGCKSFIIHADGTRT